MREHAIAPADDAPAEALATTGLFLLFAAVIAVAVCLSSLSAADTLLAAVSGGIASLSFATSLVCFGLQSREQ